MPRADAKRKVVRDPTSVNLALREKKARSNGTSETVSADGRRVARQHITVQTVPPPPPSTSLATAYGGTANPYTQTTCPDFDSLGFDLDDRVSGEDPANAEQVHQITADMRRRRGKGEFVSTMSSYAIEPMA